MLPLTKNLKYLFYPILTSLILFCSVYAGGAEEYLLFSGMEEKLTRQSAGGILRTAGVEEAGIKTFLPHIGAVRVDISRERAEQIQNLNPETLLIPAGLKLQPAVSPELNEISMSTAGITVPWHVTYAEELQAYVQREGAFFGDVVVLVIDTGVDCNHPDLINHLNMNLAMNFSGEASPDLDVTDSFGHGTNVAGVIVGDYTGICPYVSMIPLKAADDSGNLTLADLTEAFDYIIDLSEGSLAGKRLIVNLSYNTGWFYDPYPSYEKYFTLVLASLREKGILFISSAGNKSQNVDQRYVYPTSNEASNFLSASSITSSGELSYFSNYGSFTVETAAPGSEIVTTDPGGLYDSVSGTSFASPYLAAAGACIWALDPSLNYWEIRNLLINAIRDQDIQNDFLSEYTGLEGDFLYEDSSYLAYSEIGEDPLPVISARAIYPSTIANDSLDVGLAYDPYPSNGQGHVPLEITLSWSANENVESFDIYISDDLGLLYSEKGFTRTSFDVSGMGLKENYWWRVDTHAYGERETGEVWNFTTLVPGAYDPYPIDSDGNVSVENLILDWSHDLDRSSFDIYFSNSRELVENGDLSVILVNSLMASQFNITGSLEEKTNYYWKINTTYRDPVSSEIEVVQGEVWEFKTSAKDEGLTHSGGGGGGCSSISGLHNMVLMIAPLLILLKNKL